MGKINEVLDRHWEELKKLHPGVLNIAIGEKWAGGVNTHIPSITIYVAKKIGTQALSATERAPKEIEGIATDVVEISPTTWKANKTSVSDMHPAMQRKLLGVSPRPKVVGLSQGNIYSSPEVDWKAFCSPIQHQKNCGSCVGFGCIGVIETAMRIAKNDPTDPIKLSEDQAFFCSGGTCEMGSQVPTVLDWIRDNGVCPASFMPYKDSDHACNSDILPGWEQYRRKIISWTEVLDPAEIRNVITLGPAIAIMEVHQSFFNYSGGLYKNLGAGDPVVGWHCIGTIGASDLKGGWHSRNSWGTGWGEDGYFWIAYEEGHFDDVFWTVTPDMTPGPIPPPNPSPCKVGYKVAQMLNWGQKIRGRKGRFSYQNP